MMSIHGYGYGFETNNSYANGNGTGNSIYGSYGFTKLGNVAGNGRAYYNNTGYGDGCGFIDGDGQGGQLSWDLHSCTRLLSDDYPDINFYICQLKLMRGRK
jgi:hypothetical protein